MSNGKSARQRKIGECQGRSIGHSSQTIPETGQNQRTSQFTRLLTNVIDAEINAAQDHRSPKRVNFKHAVAAVFRNFEALALVQAEAVAETVARIVDDIAAFWQRERPGRSYPRMSLKPARKWTRKGKSSATT